MSTPYIYDDKVNTDEKGNLVADDTAIKQLVNHRDYLMRATAARKHREAIERFNRMPSEQEAARKQPSVGKRKRRFSHQTHRATKREMRRDATVFHAKRDNRTAIEQFTEWNTEEINCLTHCAFCKEVLPNCACFDNYEINLAEFWDEYQSMRRIHASNRRFPRTYEAYLTVRHLYIPEDYPYDYDRYGDYPLDDIGQSDPFGAGYDRYDSDYGLEVHARYAGEY